MAEQAAIAQDVVDFAEALGIGQFALAGFDWGNRAACITSILHPHVVKAQVAIGGWAVLTDSTLGWLLPRLTGFVAGRNVELVAAVGFGMGGSRQLSSRVFGTAAG